MKSYGVHCSQEIGLLDNTFESDQWAIHNLFQDCPVLLSNACQRWNHPQLLQDGFRVRHGLSVVFRKGLERGFCWQLSWACPKCNNLKSAAASYVLLLHTCTQIEKVTSMEIEGHFCGEHFNCGHLTQPWYKTFFYFGWLCAKLHFVLLSIEGFLNSLSF